MDHSTPDLIARADGDWLTPFLERAVAKKLCTQIYCTTCGALEFRRGCLREWATAVRQPAPDRFGRDAAIGVGLALARVPRAPHHGPAFEQAVRCILFDLWRTLGDHGLAEGVEPALAGTWAGDVLAGMKAHYQRRLDARRAAAAQLELIEERRAEKRRLKEQQQADRLVRKVERDRVWREKRERFGPEGTTQ
jgi:hypothetical protein